MKKWRGWTTTAAVMAFLVVLMVVQPAASAHRSVYRRQASASPTRPSFLLGLGDGERSVLGSLFDLAADDIKQQQQPPPPPQQQQQQQLQQQEQQLQQPAQTPPQEQKKEEEQQGTKKRQQGETGDIAASQAAAAAVGQLMRHLHNMTFLPLVPREGVPSPVHAPANGSMLQQYLETVRGDAWAQFKSLAMGYSSWLENEYQLNHVTEKLPLDLVKKVLDLGDRVNFLHVVGRRVNPGLAGFLADQLQPLFDHFDKLTAGRVVGGSLTNTIGEVVRDAAWKTLRQFVDHVLYVAGDAVTRDEINSFREELAKTSPLAARGLALLLDGPPQGEEGRSLSKQSYSEYPDVYGGHGSYDDSYATYAVVQNYPSGGYAAGVHIDPYLILAGLGAAVLLAYLAYRVLVTTKAAARGFRGGVDDLTLMDLSDTPSVLHSLHSLLDDAEHKYDVKRSAQRDDMDDFTDALNDLWREHERPDGCVRCALFDAALDHAGVSRSSVPALAVSWVAHLLGSKRSGQLLDEVTGQVLEGRPVTCYRHHHTCDLQ